MTDDSMTINTVSRKKLSAGRPPEQTSWLVVIDCPEEPSRIGTRVRPPRYGIGLIGRGRVREDDPHTRQNFLILRPGTQQPTPPLAIRRISRQQLSLQSRGDGVLVKNLGRRTLLRNGTPVTETMVHDGDILELENALLLLCVRGPAWLTPMPDVPQHPFGEPDENGIVGESIEAWRLRRELYFQGPRAAHVLVHGQSGVGKELAARALHALSPRAKGPFVSRNAATLPDGLIDAELFGNILNYPNPGTPARPGLIGAADTGTLFLDEFAELSEALQTHLLRVLDDGEYQRLGEAQARRADFRLVSATNRPLSTIKSDVRARLTLTLAVPDLNARRADIPLIARHLMVRIAAEDPGLRERFLVDGQAQFAMSFVTRLVRHRYTTNIRELEAMLWSAMSASTDGVLREAAVADAPTQVTSKADWRAWIGSPAEDIPPDVVQACLDEHNGIQKDTWTALGLPSRHVLARLIKRHGLVIRKQG